MIDKAWEDHTGIHYVKDRTPVKEKPRPEVCGKCGSPATCVGRLYVPCSALSANHCEDVSVLLAGSGLFWCDSHFYELKGPEFLEGERGAQIREAVGREFVKRNAVPNFAKAVIGRIPTTDDDYLRAQKAIDMARQQ